MNIIDEKSRKELCDALHYMAERNDVIQDTHGNLSIKVDDKIYIKPSGMQYKKIVATDICIYYIKQNTLGGNRKPSVDLKHHIAIYEKDSAIKSICHTHSPYATAYAIANLNIKCCTTEQADYFGDDIYVEKYSDLNSWGKNINLNGYKKASLLQHHGIVTYGKNALHAVNLAIALENIAKKNFLVRALTMQSFPLRHYEIKKWHKRYNTVYGQ